MTSLKNVDFCDVKPILAKVLERYLSPKLVEDACYEIECGFEFEVMASEADELEVEDEA